MEVQHFSSAGVIYTIYIHDLSLGTLPVDPIQFLIPIFGAIR